VDLQRRLVHERAVPDNVSMPFEIRTHARYNPAGKTELNIVPGLVGTILTMTMLIFTALSVTRELERGTMEALLAMPLRDGEDASIELARKSLIAAIGENINVRRFIRLDATKGILAHYQHGVRIGVLVELQGGDTELARDIAMHIAASKPQCVNEADVSREIIEKEREIFSAQAETSGKPANIIEKMVDGRIRKFLAEITLVGQPFVKDPDQSVGQLLKSAGAGVIGFARMELGEGIEKKSENFADEVMAQVKGV